MPNAKKILVTGAGSGIGRAVAQALLKAGNTVIATGRREALLHTLAEANSTQLHVLPCDLSQPQHREGLVRKAAALAGGLDGLVYSAGVVSHQTPGAVGEEELRLQLEVNLVAPMRLGEEALKVLNPGGAMVFVGSTLATRPVVSSMVYSASKAGLEAAMKSLALAGAPQKIRANVVSPGVVDTEMIRQPRPHSRIQPAPGLRDPAHHDPEHYDPGLQSPRPKAPESHAPTLDHPALHAPAPDTHAGFSQGDEDAERLERLRGLHPLGRLGSAQDVASAVLFLLFAPWITGSTLVCDGGLLLRE